MHSAFSKGRQMARRLRYPLTRSMLLAVAGVALASGSGDGQAASAASASFLPHQAVYDLTLVKSRGSASIDTARGRILYNFSGSDCEGYNSEFWLVYELNRGEGKVSIIDLCSISW